VKFTSITHSNIPLCVDLDHTLYKTDFLYETLLFGLKSGSITIYDVIRELGKGKSFLKNFIANNVTIEVSLLPKNQEIWEYAKLESKNRPVVLVTATNTTLAQQVARYAGFFSEVIASSKEVNLKGSAKHDELVKKFGVEGFDYIGDNPCDLEVWKSCRYAYPVTSNKQFINKVEQVAQIQYTFPLRPHKLQTLLKALRLHQWSKNVLIFVPIIAAHELEKSSVIFTSILAFISFSVTASSVYLVNDLLDLESDRKHRTKFKRPFASGDLPLTAGFYLVPLLGLLALITGLPVGFSFLFVLCGYFILTSAYTLWAKQKPILDVVLLASLYTVRILAGAVAASVLVSEWLLSFSMFLFFSLACAKRFSEINYNVEDSQSKVPGRGYYGKDKELLGILGVSSGLLSVLVLALYVTAQEVVALYDHPRVLMYLCPMLLYWIARVWLLTYRGELHEDPVTFALKDKTSYLIMFAFGLALALAT
jgi:4-hydroxybenzoate polyprenyltransferase